jgi:ATP-dependent helicase/nuclease subunit A
MTRAAERLVVCGTQGKIAIPDGCWYRLIDDALRSESVREQADDGVGEVWRYRKGGAAEPEAERPAISTAPESKPERPRWLTEPAVVEPLAIGRIRPSSAADDDDDRPSGGGTATALLRGSLTHRLLQSLPDIAPVSRAKAAADFLARNGGDLSAADRGEIAGKIASVLGDARFAPLFAPGSRAEVPIVGRVDVGGKIVAVSGQIDRVAIGAGSVLIGDFKTNRPAPRRIEEVPRAYIRQLALYRALLTKLYPGKSVRAVLIWTEVPDLMELSDDLLDRTLAQVTSA